MELRWLEAFVAVAEELHFGRAAQRLRMAQSPLSQTVRKLEKDVGADLFTRSTRSVALTGAGHALLPHAYRVLDEVRLAQRAPTIGAGTVYGKVSIGFSGALNHRTLPPLIRALRERHPGIEVDLVSRVLTGEAAEKLANGSLDLAFVGLPMPTGRWQTRRIARERLGVLLPSDHRLADQTQIDLADMAGEPFVIMPLHSQSTVTAASLAAFSDSGIRPLVVQEVPDPYIAMTLVASGMGCAVMPESITDIVPAGAEFRYLSEPSRFHEHGLAWREDSASGALEAVLAIADEVLPEPTHLPDRRPRSASTGS